MSTLTEIQEALPQLSPAELRQLARGVDRLFRARAGSALHDDAHGTMTEADLIVAADQAFLEYDCKEGNRAQRNTR